MQYHHLERLKYAFLKFGSNKELLFFISNFKEERNLGGWIDGLGLDDIEKVIDDLQCGIFKAQLINRLHARIKKFSHTHTHP